MTIALLDVHYTDHGARAACVVAPSWTSPLPMATHIADIATVQDYEPGAFYRRELPCLLQVLAMLGHRADVLVVHGYAWLLDDQHPGLGAHLHHATGLPVVGVAKTAFRDADTAASVAKVLRGASRRPLYVTAAGLELATAATAVHAMAGEHRMPTLLAAVDALARSGAVTA